MRTTARYLLNAACVLYGALTLVAAAPSQAAIPLASTPLFLTVSVPPNVTLTLDDSQSMGRAFLPESECNPSADDCSTLDNRYEKAANKNFLAYNPNKTYAIPKKADGTLYSTSFTAAYINGFDTTVGTPVNLSTSYQPTASLMLRSGGSTHSFMGHYTSDSRCNTTGSPRMCQLSNGSGGWLTTITACATTTTPDSPTKAATRDASCRGLQNSGYEPAKGPAYYYVYDSTLTGCSAANPNACYKLVIVSETSGPGGTDERQNFANWYSFARTRNLATMTGASVAFASMAPTVRVAWQALNSCNTLTTTSCKGWKTTDPGVSNAIKPFDGQHKADFYSWVTRLPTNGSTPLPAALKRVGEYYKKNGENSPYDNDFTTSSSGEYGCRRNYHIMMTDGMWNSALAFGEMDNATHPLPEPAPNTQPPITQYAPKPPYADPTSNTLADIAFYYWINDLRGTAVGTPPLINNLAGIYNDTSGTSAETYWNPRNDPATWQHMVNFTIGLGLSPTLAQTSPALTWGGNTYNGSYPLLLLGGSPAAGISWPAAASGDSNPANVADLWHAAINSRGQFFAADDPVALGTAFQQILTAIAGDSGSSAALSTNSTSIQPGTTVVYQAKFNKDWSGTLLALPIDADGVIGTPVWDASKLIPAHDKRKIFTYNDQIAAGVVFDKCSNLSATQKGFLDHDSLGTLDNRCGDRLNWLRGDPTLEQRFTNGIFRNRPSTVMGDVINSDPAYVKNIDYGYSALDPTTPGQSSYAGYVSGNASRMPMVYVGANDGRMYGIRGDQGDAQSGVEQFSYVPAGVYPHLTDLTDVAYAHRYYVDGGITAGDAYLGGSWRTVVLGGLNAGGNTIYALDVTDPTNFSEKNVLWEFSDTAVPGDMGMSFSQPQIGILDNGTWVAVFGNGYNSATGGAYLYVVNLQTGALIRKIKASDQMDSVDPTKDFDESNGLSTPVLFDSNKDGRIDTVYAGDLRGNMWKFDLSSTSAAAWGVAFSGAPLFTARYNTNQVQPITAQPKVGGHPLGGFLVYFGTGEYLTAADAADTTTVQSFYGIWDNGAAVATIDRSELQQQTINLQMASDNREVRSITSNTPDWGTKKGWFLDLLDKAPPPSTAAPTPAGERVVSTAIVKENRVIFVSLVPSVDPCIPGGSSWLMEVDQTTGGAPPSSILDINGDGKFDTNDLRDGKVVTGVRTTSLGISKTPVWIDVPAPNGIDPPSMALKVMTGTGGGFVTERNSVSRPPPPPGAGTVIRRSWIQIR